MATPSGLRVGGIAELADLDLWLALTEPDLSRLNLLGAHEGHASPDQQRVASLMPLGGFAQYDSGGQLGVAAFPVPSGPGGPDRPIEVAVHGYGPGGVVLARYLAERASLWDGLGRPGAASLELAAYPAGTRPEAVGSSMVICRPNSVLVAGWPTQA